MGTQGYLAPQFIGTKKWFIPGENGGHASKQQMSFVQEGEFGVKSPDVPSVGAVLEQGWSKRLNLNAKLRYSAEFSQNLK